MTTPLFATRDQTLLDELLRLAAAAGVRPDVAADAAAALRGWAGAGLVLVGADLAAEVARLMPPRRPGVHVVAWGVVPDDLFRAALAVGAESVVGLPASAAWLTETLTDLGDAGPPATTLGVLGGSGGAGATTFAGALAQVAAAGGDRVLAVDADPLGPGLDRVLGLEHVDGVRWEALCQTTGRLSARSLRDAVPRRSGVGVLTWQAHRRGATPPTLQAFAVREALSAGARGHDVVVVDLPRHVDGVVDEVVSRCDRVLLVVSPSVSGTAAAVRTVARFPDRSRLAAVVRGGAVDPDRVGRVLGVPVLATMRDQRGLAESIDLGLGPVRSTRGPLGRAAREVLGLRRPVGAVA
ncbi:septum site-determining protein Ssd [Nocardioides sp. SYSU D00038]|uniref:septum site-determining protein Ssd n=1 Tax=Nocardioides sp. SYSU D00038 TaxID=2812554 RepID=UPI0019676913|nr:septum site-determining protein Ssd [Nocardioides sp. SYSU D00038]